MGGHGKNRGATLIVVLGVLVVLSLVGTSFAVLQQVERSVSRNYLDDVRAKLIAKSGVEDGLQRMQQLVEASFGTGGNLNDIWRYYGNDVNEVGNTSLMNVALADAENPSFAIEMDGDPINANPAPRTMTVEGKQIGISGFHDSGSYASHGDFYSLHIRDLQGLIHINDGIGIPGHTDANGDGMINDNDSSVSQNLTRILNNLGTIPSIGINGLGNNLIDNRPVTGFAMLEQIEPLLGTTDFLKVKNFLTAHAWVDKDVANPVPFGGQFLNEYPIKYYRGSGIYRYGRNRNYQNSLSSIPIGFLPPATNNVENGVYGLDELNPQFIEIVSRAPVNINSAPEEVLISLLAGLRGVFMVETRRNEVPGVQTAYQWFRSKHTYDPLPDWTGTWNSPVQITSRDDIGKLYQTIEIVGPAGGGTITSGGTILAVNIAKHIIACREKQATSGVAPAFDYSDPALWWNGTFRNWRQFNAFVDNLVAIGMFADNRSFLVDNLQKAHGAQAIASVLKANFNPNLHLNEANPDQNLFQLVDKTDLIVNSTEFCFLPYGYFSIESLGRVVKPQGNGPDSYSAPNNKIVAEKKVSAVVKLYDAIRQTSQKQFYGGTLASKSQPTPTNNNRSLEIGPEPDQGNIPAENEWGGYIALPTIGGHTTTTAPNTTTTTPNDSTLIDQRGSVMHGHFTYDFKLHHHVDGDLYRQDLASNTSDLSGEKVRNIPDRTESIPGPYDATMNGGDYYRLARSFRLQAGISPPPMAYSAPVDMRIDGGYSERHAASAYWLSHNTFHATIGDAVGTFAMWLKPSFFPEMAGKPRQIFTTARYHSNFSGYMNPSPFALFFTASHDAPPGSSSVNEGGSPEYVISPFGVAPFPPSALGFGWGYSGATGYTGGSGGIISEGGTVTPTLNHISHPHTLPSPLQAHKWAHIVTTWKTTDVTNDRPEVCSIFVNSVEYNVQTRGAFYGQHAVGVHRSDSTKDWTMHDGGERNTWRLGAVSKYRTNNGYGYDWNWPADSTMDEIYLWNSLAGQSQVNDLWENGRYYKPDVPYEGFFTSAEINLTAGARSMAPPSVANPPTITGPGGSGAPNATNGFTAASSVQILGVSWTWFTDGVDDDGLPILEDALTNDDLYPEITIKMDIGGTVYGPFTNDNFSRAVDAMGNPLSPTAPFKYQVFIDIPDAQFDSILLSTPVFDDITIFYRTAGAQYVGYYIE